MGYYSTEEGPPGKDRRPKWVPRWLIDWWEGLEEIWAITRMTFGIIFPILGVLLGFVLFCAGGLFLLSLLSGGP